MIETDIRWTTVQLNLRSWNVEIKGAGGVVRYVKDPVSGFVEVLLIQTRDMREFKVGKSGNGTSFGRATRS